MKKLILILMLGSLFAQDNQKLSDTAKMIYYESVRKNALTAVTLEILIPNGGYHYLERAAITNLPFSLIRWGSGVASIYYSYSEKEERLDKRSIGLLCAIENGDYNDLGKGCGGWIDKGDEEFLFPLFVYSLFTIIQMHDLIEETAEYNNNVYRKIFNSEPPSFSLNLQPTYQGANLTMSYAFD